MGGRDRNRLTDSQPHRERGRASDGKRQGRNRGEEGWGGGGGG